MKNLSPILSGFVILLAVNSALADSLPPNLTPQEEQKWRRDNPWRPRGRPLPALQPPPLKAAVLVIDATTQNVVRVVLPARLVKELQEAAQGASVGPTSRLPWPNLMVGLSLSMALACVGLGMVRSKRRMTFVALFCLTGATMLAGLGCPAPQTIVPNNPVTENLYKELDAKSNLALERTASVEVRDDADNVQIIVDKTDMKSFMESANVPTKP